MSRPAQLEPAGDNAGSACLTCADEAVEVRVVQLLPGAMAVVSSRSGEAEVSVALVCARVGDTVLVHAKEAIALVRPAPAAAAGGEQP
jgi:hydrogenase maturation factor